MTEKRVSGCSAGLRGLAVAAGVAGLAGGCATNRVTDPPRTATEQFLLSQAAASAVERLSFDVLRGRRVFLDPQYYASIDREYVLGEIRAKLLRSDVQVAPTVEEAQVVVEVRSSGLGIDRNDYLFGVPSLQLAADPFSATAAQAPLLTPELAIVKNRYQRGVAGVAYVAYWSDTGEIVASSGPFIGQSYRDDWWFFGLGPRSRGDIAPVQGAP